MPRKKEVTWITAKAAAKLLNDKYHRAISDRYIRRLAEQGKIDSQEITTHQKLYSKEDVEALTPSERAGKPRSEAKV
jgi:hypothetical protein